MPIFIDNCDFSGNGRGMVICGLRALYENITIKNTVFSGNKHEGLLVDISDDRKFLGIPSSVPDQYLIDLVEYIKLNPKAPGLADKILAMEPWVSLGAISIEIVEKVIAFLGL